MARRRVPTATKVLPVIVPVIFLATYLYSDGIWTSLKMERAAIAERNSSVSPVSQNFLAGCRNVYLDVGSNIGIQERKYSKLIFLKKNMYIKMFVHFRHISHANVHPYDSNREKYMQHIFVIHSIDIGGIPP